VKKVGEQEEEEVEGIGEFEKELHSQPNIHKRRPGQRAVSKTQVGQ